jgi:riboflavin biosynthesis pyrimidine reductase
MRQLYPHAADNVDPATLYDRLRRVGPRRPGVRENMIASADGASSAGGLSGALGGPVDQALFATLRSLADVVVVGAGTMRAEGYGPARLGLELQTARQRRGLPAVPPIAVVTRSCRLDWQSAFFTEAEQRPVVITVASAEAGDRRRAEDVAEVIVAGERNVDLGQALAALAAQGAENVLAEGGPSLNAQLLVDDLIDELCLTVSPTLLGGGTGRIVTGGGVHPPVPLILAHVAEEDDFLFLRYRRRP